MGKDITKLSDAELSALAASTRVELGELEAEKTRRYRERAAKQRRRIEKLLKDDITNVDLFVMDHSRNNCSDEKPGNSGEVRCLRCFLIAVAKDREELANGYFYSTLTNE